MRLGSAAGTIVPAGLEGSGESDGGVVGATVVRNDDPKRRLGPQRADGRGLGWRRVEVVREIPGLGYRSAAQGIRRFWSQRPKDPENESFRQEFLPQGHGSRSNPIGPLCRYWS